MTKLQARVKERRHIDLAGAVLPRANLSHADFSGADLKGINLSGANLTMAFLVGADLSNAVLRDADLAFADFTDADLSGTDLSGARLNKARFRRVDLMTTRFQGADLRGANFGDAKNLTWRSLLDGRVDVRTKFPDYLSNDDLFEVLEELYQGVDWRSDCEGNLERLFDELNKIAEAAGEGSFANALIRASVAVRMSEQ